MLSFRAILGASGYTSSGGGGGGPFSTSTNYMYGAANASTQPVNIIQQYNGTTRTTESATLTVAKYGTQIGSYLDSTSKDYIFGGLVGTLSYNQTLESYDGSTRASVLTMSANNYQSAVAFPQGSDNFHKYANSLYKWTGTVHSSVVTTTTIGHFGSASYFPDTGNGYAFTGTGKFGDNKIIRWNGTTETLETATQPGDRYGHVASYLTSTTIYVLGGYDYNGGSPIQGLTSIHKWNASTYVAESATLSPGVQYASGAFMDDNIYVYGGSTGSSTVSTIQKFNGTTRSTESATLAAAYTRMAACEL